MLSFNHIRNIEYGIHIFKIRLNNSRKIDAKIV